MEYALAQPSFFGRGGTLRFACQHMYPYVKYRAFVPLDNQPQLKGADACLVAMAQSLRLAVRIRLCPNFDPHCNATSVCEKDATQVCMEYGERELLKTPLLNPSLHHLQSCIMVLLLSTLQGGTDGVSGMLSPT